MSHRASPTAVRGTVFEALDLADTPELRVRVDLAAAITREVRRVMEGDQRSQRSVADTMGLHPTDLSKLMNGVVEEFSQERLQRALAELGCDIEITVRRAATVGAAEVRVDTSELEGPVG